MKMPWGTFEGRNIHEIPRYYLHWALESLDLQHDVKTAMEMGLNRKEWNPQPTCELESLVHEICGEWGE